LESSHLTILSMGDTVRGQGAGTRSMFGPQPLSPRKSAPAFGFGTSSRESFRRQFVSAAQAAKAPGVGRSPGAVYEVRGAIGRQVNSRRRNAPSYGFGSSSRLGGLLVQSPGPGSYCV